MFSLKEIYTNFGCCMNKNINNFITNNLKNNNNNSDDFLEIIKKNNKNINDIYNLKIKNNKIVVIYFRDIFLLNL
jgi:transcriptional regulatory protein LevR